MAINLGSAYGKVSLDSSGIKSGVSNGIASLKTLETAGLAIGGAMQKIGGAMTLGLTVPIVAFFKASIDSAIEAESALAELNAVLRSTGGAAGLTADEITHMASELQKVTKFSDDQIISGQSMLLTFTKIGKDVFPLATEAMLNMAEKFGSIETASVQLGKALNDPIAGVSALRRVGVMLTQEQEDQIKGFMAVNDIASAQKVILQELEVEFGGLAKAAGDTTAGKLAQLTNAFDDLKETVGAAFIPTLLKLAEGLTKLIEKFMAMPPWMQKVIIVLLALAALAGPVLILVGTIISAIGTIAGFITTLGGLGITVAGIGTALATLGTAFGAIGTFITVTLIPAIVALVTPFLPVILIVLAVAAVIYLLYLAWKKNLFGIQDLVHKSAEGYKQTWERFTTWWQKSTEDASTNIKKNLGNISTAFHGVVEAIQKDGYQFTLLFEDGSGALLDLAVAFGIPEKAAQDFGRSIWLIMERFHELITAIQTGGYAFTVLFEDGSGALLDLATALGIPEKAAQKFLARIWYMVSTIHELIDAIRLGGYQFTVLFEDGSGALLDLAEAFGIPVKGAQDFLAKLYFIVDNIRTLFSRAREYIVNAFTKTDWGTVGKYILLGLANGMLLGLPTLLAIVVKVATAVLTQIKKSLGIGSPSTEAMKLGAFTAQGFALGMQTMKPDDMARSLTKPITNNSNSNQQVINQHFASGLTLTQVRGMIEQNNEQLVNTMVNALGGA